MTGAPGRIACPKACRAGVRAGTVVRLTARPSAGWSFLRWTGACKGTKTSCAVRVKKSTGAVATFRKKPAPPAPKPAPEPAGFTPAFIAGTWNGSWRNQTFGTTGSAQFAVATPTPSSFTFQATLGGNVFGCPTPPPASGEITQGTGVNHWNADGFTVKTQNSTVSYDFKANAFTGNGVSSCNPGITWTIKGAFDGNAFSGTVSISLPGGVSATSVIELKR